jgi:hypothetical protein
MVVILSAITGTFLLSPTPGETLSHEISGFLPFMVDAELDIVFIYYLTCAASPEVERSAVAHGQQ